MTNFTIGEGVKIKLRDGRTRRAKIIDMYPNGVLEVAKRKTLANEALNRVVRRRSQSRVDNSVSVGQQIKLHLRGRRTLRAEVLGVESNGRIRVRPGKVRLRRRRLHLFEPATLVAILALAVSGVVGYEQLQISQQQTVLGSKQTDLAASSLSSARFQSVYERMLDVDKAIADKPEVAQIIEKTDSTGATEVYIIDFYQYIWDYIPSITAGDSPNAPTLLALRQPLPGSVSPDRPSHWEDAQWESWQTWSETIAGGFRSPTGDEVHNPSKLCTVLQQNRDSYGDAFVNAIRDAGLCPDTILPPS